MKTNECDHKVSFGASLLVTNPYNYPCPHCKKRLTLDKTGRRYLVVAIVASSLYAGIIGTFSTLSAFKGAQMAQIIIFNLLGIIVGILALLPLLYIAWKRSRFIERKKLEQVRQLKKEVSVQRFPVLRQTFGQAITNNQL
ncbi:MAG: hypothetical protein ACPGSB_09995 [Opitutales bacterium]